MTHKADVCFIERAFAALRKWLHPPPFSQLPSVVTWAGGVRAGACQGDKGTTGGQGEFVMPDCNPFLRRALYESLEQHFPDLWAESREIPGSHRSGHPPPCLETPLLLYAMGHLCYRWLRRQPGI